MSKVIVKCGSAFRTTLAAPKYEKKKIIMKCENNLFRDEQFPKTNYSKLCAAPARPTPSQRSQPPDKNNNILASIFFFFCIRVATKQTSDSLEMSFILFDIFVECAAAAAVAAKKLPPVKCALMLLALENHDANGDYIRYGSVWICEGW